MRSAMESFQKIEKLASALDKLSTKRSVLGQGQTGVDKFKNLFKSTSWSNSIEDLTDRTFFSNYKGERAQKIAVVQKNLQEEVATFDDYLRLLQIKIIEAKIKQNTEELNRPATILKLMKDIIAFRASLSNLNTNLMDLNSQKSRLGKQKREQNSIALTKSRDDYQRKLENTQNRLNKLWEDEAIMWVRGNTNVRNKVWEEMKTLKSDDPEEKQLLIQATNILKTKVNDLRKRPIPQKSYNELVNKENGIRKENQALIEKAKSLSQKTKLYTQGMETPYPKENPYEELTSAQVSKLAQDNKKAIESLQQKINELNRKNQGIALFLKKLAQNSVLFPPEKK